MSETTKKTLRIAIDIRILGKKRTGDETVFYELTREVLKQDKENQYFLLTNETDEQVLFVLKKRLGIEEGNSKQEIVLLKATNRFVWNLVTLPSYLKKARIDVFHTQYILPFWVPSTTRVINHIHDVSFCAYPALIGKKDLFFLNLLIPRSLRMSDTIVTPSVFTKQEIEKYYHIDSSKIMVISNAVGSDFLAVRDTTDSKESDVRTKYGLPEKYILYVGTLQPRKNIPFLVQAFAQYHKQSPEVSLVLVGNKKGHHFDTAIDEAVKAYEVQQAVVFPGYVDEADLPIIYRMAEVFVFPSLYEGFGIPVLEAMSMGVPVIASDQACLEEIGGDAALYYKQNNVDSLAQILYSLEVTNALKESLREKGKERVNDFSWQKSGTKLVSLYTSETSKTF